MIIQLLDALGNTPHFLNQMLGILFFPLQPGHLFGDLVTLGFQLLNLGQHAAPLFIQGQQLIDGGSLALFGHPLTHSFWVLANQSYIQHGTYSFALK